MTQVHDGDSIADMFNHGQVMGDKDIGQPFHADLQGLPARLIIWAWIETSRAEIGPSQTIREGFGSQRSGLRRYAASDRAELMRKSGHPWRGPDRRYGKLIDSGLVFIFVFGLLCTTSGSPNDYCQHLTGVK
jgi:hypothetical protein